MIGFRHNWQRYFQHGSQFNTQVAVCLHYPSRLFLEANCASFAWFINIHIGYAKLRSYMNFFIKAPLNADAAQTEPLVQLQARFAQACSMIAVVVQQTQVWNRVALHHVVYKKIRQAFPELGSQMVCNAIYCVSRASRIVYQSPNSPYRISQLAGRKLPLLKFASSCPVYFDRHTLSLKNGQLSMYTLDGRIKFEVKLAPSEEAAFREKKLRETVLLRGADGTFKLVFWLTDIDPTSEHSTELEEASSDELENHLVIEEVV